MNQLEYILCAANHYDDGLIRESSPVNISSGFVICGRRHFNCIAIFAEIVGFPYSKKAQRIHNTEKQGFLTNHNRWVNRIDAAEIAFLAGQIAQRTEHPVGLFSEDLY